MFGVLDDMPCAKARARSSGQGGSSGLSCLRRLCMIMDGLAVESEVAHWSKLTGAGTGSRYVAPGAGARRRANMAPVPVR
jgi:hypothetical protein